MCTTISQSWYKRETRRLRVEVARYRQATQVSTLYPVLARYSHSSASGASVRVVSVVYRHTGAHTENHSEALASLDKLKELDEGGQRIRDEPSTNRNVR